MSNTPCIQILFKDMMGVMTYLQVLWTVWCAKEVKGEQRPRGQFCLNENIGDLEYLDNLEKKVQRAHG